MPDDIYTDPWWWPTTPIWAPTSPPPRPRPRPRPLPDPENYLPEVPSYQLPRASRGIVNPDYRTVGVVSPGDAAILVGGASRAWQQAAQTSQVFAEKYPIPVGEAVRTSSRRIILTNAARAIISRLWFIPFLSVEPRRSADSRGRRRGVSAPARREPDPFGNTQRTLDAILRAGDAYRTSRGATKDPRARRNTVATEPKPKKNLVDYSVPGFTAPRTAGQAAGASRKTSKSPGTATSPQPTTPAPTAAPSTWFQVVWPYAEKFLQAVKPGPSTPKEKKPKAAAAPEAVPTTSSSAPTLTQFQDPVIPFASPYTASFMQPRGEPSTQSKRCNCPTKPKKKRGPTCRNPVISKTTRDGVRTTKVQLICQPSKRK